jgi:nitroreductase
MTQASPINNQRKTDYPVNSQFTDRWSPRALTGEPIAEAELMSMLEAARWAPSSNNAQPWRFAVVLRSDPQWDALFNTLNPSNQTWAGKASALVAIASANLATKAGSTESLPNGMHAFDTGAAWAYMALQAHLNGWSMHGIGGFNKEAGAQVLNLPANHTLQMLAAVGKRGDAAQLPDALREREAPNARQPLSSLAKRGSF